jgi:hypothetical protein
MARGQEQANESVIDLHNCHFAHISAFNYLLAYPVMAWLSRRNNIRTEQEFSLREPTKIFKVGKLDSPQRNMPHGLNVECGRR